MFTTWTPGAPALVRPLALSIGERVAIVAPCSPFPRDTFDRGLRALESLGLQVTYGEGLFARHPGAEGYLAGDDARRLAELRSALADPTTSLLVPARGGYGLVRLLGSPGDPATSGAAGSLCEPLSLAEIAQARKLVVGYSDAAVLHELWARAGVPSIHGPMCTQLGEDPAALLRLRALLFGDDPGPISWAPLPVAQARGGRVSAVLRGGNLSVLAALCGTPLQPRFSGCIALLEDLNEPPYRLDRLVTQLLLSGALSGVRGVVVGDLVGPGEPSQGRAEAVAERLSGLGVPVAFGAPFGHAGRNQPVAFGCSHALDADAGTLTQLQSPVAARKSLS